MSLTIKSCYAIRGLYELGKMQEQSREENKKIFSIAQISQSAGIPQEFLAKIFADLKKTGIIDSEKGKFGGFFLTKKPEDIKLSEVVKVLEVPLNSYDCITQGVCVNQKNCSVDFVWERLEKAIFRELEDISLKDVLEYGKRKEKLYQKS
jgi:Rrf2 family iron-sulfur cluster assembly transcriptional regulator